MEYVHTVACALVLTAIVAAEARRLNEWVTHFEPLWYEPLRIQRQHVRLRRSLQQQLQRQHQQSPVFLHFWAFDKNFILRMRPDLSSFHEDFTLETETLGKIRPELGHIYSGQLVGDPSSRVFGALHSGVFEGSIRSSQGTFYMERSRKLFGGRTEPPFHSLMYSQEDVRIPAVCGVVDDVRTWMDMQAPEHSAAERSDRATMRRLLSSTGELPNTTRARGGRERRVCNLEVNVDHLLHAHFLDDARGDGARARERITAMVAQHVARASDVFRAANFGGVEDISFAVQRIRINDSHSCATGKTAHEQNPFCAPAADIGYLLHLTSLSNHDEFCLSYTWTYRDFYGGVLGLAWVANAERNYGGVCEKARPSAVSVGGSTEVLRLSTNVGVLTFVNYNSFVATAVSEMVFCHELGHSFGADHDAPPGRSCYGTCAPCGDEGNYIMFPSPTQGKKPNNDKFSQCSRNSIGRVLAPMIAGESARENCLQAHSGPICGNGVVERGEQCDCGSHDADCSDQCCHSRHNVDGAAGCTLRAGANCSPSAGQCCDESCGFKNVSTVCGEETECREQAVCDGEHAACTPGPAKAETTPCAGGTRVCVQGECSHSVCLKYGLRECSLAGDRYSAQQLCLLACQDESGSCKPGCDLALASASKALCGLRLPPGSPCNEQLGYCDVFQRCRPVDDEGPLTRIQRLFFGTPVDAIRLFIVSDPPRAVLVLAVSCWLVALAFRCCAALTPTDNPHKSRHQHIMQWSPWD